MSGETYFVVSGSEDGDIRLEQLTREELVRRLKPNEFGDAYYGRRIILDRLPKDLGSFADLVIIKGAVVVPTPKQVATEFDVP